MHAERDRRLERVPGRAPMPNMSQLNVTSATPMGATLVVGGATFRVWAPLASAVYLNGVFGGVADWSKDASANLMVRDAAGYWTGFLPGSADDCKVPRASRDQAPLRAPLGLAVAPGRVRGRPVDCRRGEPLTTIAARHGRSW